MSTWSEFFTLICMSVSSFLLGIVWEEDRADKREEQRAARRRAHRYAHDTTERKSQ